MSPKRVNDLFLKTFGIPVFDQSTLQSLGSCKSLKELSMGKNRIKEFTIYDSCPVGTFLFFLKQSLNMDVTGFLSPYPKSLTIGNCHKFKIHQGEMVCHNLPIGRDQMEEYIDKLSSIVPTDDELFVITSEQVKDDFTSFALKVLFPMSLPTPNDNWEAVRHLNKRLGVDIKTGMKEMFPDRLHPVFGFPTEDLYSLPFKVLLPTDLGVDDVTVNTYFENWNDTMVLTSMTVSPKNQNDKRVFDVILPKEFDYLRNDSIVI
jgi:hypothetical protein